MSLFWLIAEGMRYSYPSKCKDCAYLNAGGGNIKLPLFEALF